MGYGALCSPSRAASEAEVRGAAAQRAKLPIGRLSGEDIHSFIIPVVGTLATSTVADFEAVQVVAPGKGPFSVKSIPSGGKYATVPQLSVLRTALDAVVVMVDDRRVLPTQNKGLQEPAMLVIDRWAKHTCASDTAPILSGASKPFPSQLKCRWGRFGCPRTPGQPGHRTRESGTTPDADVLGKLLVVLLRPTEVRFASTEHRLLQGWREPPRFGGLHHRVDCLGLYHGMRLLTRKAVGCRLLQSMNEERNEGQEIVERMLNPGAAGF
eukprot:scaffold4990_cov387-Prasinococcus_capsulatus_cf.AAC.42